MKKNSLIRLSITIAISMVIFLFAAHVMAYPVSQGGIHNGRYQGVMGNPVIARFSIGVPASSLQEFNTTRIVHAKENAGQDFAFLSFGPTSADDTLYRVNIILNPNMPLEKIKIGSISTFGIQAQEIYGAKLVKVFGEEMSINGQQVTYRIYTQQTSRNKYIHAFYFINYGKYSATFWIQTTEGKAIKNMMNGTWVPALEFVKSLRI